MYIWYKNNNFALQKKKKSLAQNKLTQYLSSSSCYSENIFNLFELLPHIL